MKFRSHLLVLVLAVTLPLLVLSAAVTAWAAMTARAATLKGMTEISGALQAAIDRQIQTTVAVLQGLATSPALDQAVAAATGANPDPLGPFRKQALELVRQRPDALYNIVLYRLDGQQLVNTLVAAGGTLPTIDAIRAPPGNSAAADPRTVLAKIVNARRPVVTNLFWGPVANRFLIAIALAVVRDDKVVSVILADLQATSFNEALREQQRPDGWIASLVDGSGLVIARSADDTRFIAQPAAAEELSFVRGTGQDGLIETAFLGGGASYGALRRLTTANWVVGYGAARSVVNAPMWHALIVVGVGGSVALIAISGAAWLIGRRLGREVESLARPAAALAEGVSYQSDPEPVSTIAEVRLVRRSLTAAAQTLAAREAALRSLNDSLESRVRAAVEEQEATRAQLLQAQKMEALGQLTGGLAHDFNNLLAAVLGSLELLGKRVPADDARAMRLLDTAQRGAQRGAALTQRLLAFGRRQTLNPESVDLPALIRGMSGLLRSSLGTGIRIDTHFPAGLPNALVDANQLELALLNLAVNARDAMPRGGQLTIMAHEAPAGPDDAGTALSAGAVVLSVIDTGDGMDEAMLARAIEPFFTTKGIGKGSGLGLSMVHGLAAQSGGRLVLRSRKGKGTTAELWLPRALDLALTGYHDIEAPGETPSIDGQRRAVLIVDDDPLVLMSTASMLEDLGFIVHEAASGARALEILQFNPLVDLVLTDQSMPGMTGVELAAALRKVRPDLPVLLATGYIERADVVEAGLPLVAKPFDQASLALEIARCLNASSLVSVDLRQTALSDDPSAD